MENKCYNFLREFKHWAIQKQKYELASYLRDMERNFFVGVFNRNDFMKKLSSVSNGYGGSQWTRMFKISSIYGRERTI
jgi:hypothetical protein